MLRLGLIRRPVLSVFVCALACTTALACGPESEPGDGDYDDEELLDGEFANGAGEGQADADADEDADEDEDAEDQNDLMGEACEENRETRACGAEDEGLQFCSYINGELEWGPCLDSVECTPGDTKFCDYPEDMEWACSDGNVSCSVYGGVPEMPECECNTPLVFSFDGRPVRYSTGGAAAFDISGGESCLATDWPEADTPWLALDRDGNGMIDAGNELFGSGTVMASGSKAQHGFMALRELDHNGDGEITAADPAFAELVLWSDFNGDRRSSMLELEPLASRGVEAIELSYTADPRCDARGNCEVERSSFRFAGAAGDARVGEVVDVYLACQ